MSTETYKKFMNLFSGSAIGVEGSRIVFFLTQQMRAIYGK